ncbi:hypothetical protein DAMA08_034930 [Martiniozyma asiatica (nom. inval.)]|nr:hypothetical protein DAMA08_034930 [Martiniozyma asiatica]
MVSLSLREIISLSRKAARELKNSLEDIGELLRQRQLEGSLQRAPVRVPVQSRPQHPLSRSVPRRHFSTNSTRALYISKDITFHGCRHLQPPRAVISGTMRRAIYQVQPFRLATRAQLGFINRGGVGSGMYGHFARHNARMFSTFGPSVGHQAAQNLSQGIRAMFLKSGEFSVNCMKTNSTGLFLNGSVQAELNANANANANVHANCNVHDGGSFVEFDISTPSIEQYLPEAGFFDEELSKHIESIFTESMRHHQKVLSDVNLFRENIGSPMFKCNKGRLRFYCPNCETWKLRSLLRDHGITTGYVSEMENSSELLRSESESESESEFESSDYGSVLSNYDELSSSTSGSESVLSASDYFERA